MKMDSNAYNMFIWTFRIIAVMLSLNSGVLAQECDGVSVDNICYTIVPLNKTWADAEAYCRQYGGYLASINNQQVHTAIVNHVATRWSARIIPALWIGLYETVDTFQDRIWKWLDGTMPSPQGCYNENTEAREFSALQVAIPQSPYQCIVTCRNQDYRYAAVQNGGTCYCGNSTFGTYSSTEFCNSRCATSNSLTIWCGGREANHVYDVNGNFALWGFQEPSNYQNYQHCVALDQQLSNFKFSDEKCSHSFYYICRKRDSTSCSQLIDEDREGFYYQGHLTDTCYFFSTTKVTWYTAKEKCKQKADVLVKIEGSVNELSEMYTEIRTILISEFQWKSQIPSDEYTGSKLWIGLSRTRWRWATGATLAYTGFNNWFMNEPSSADQLCAMMTKVNSWMWSDEMCTSYSYFICQEGDLPKITTTTTTSSPVAQTTPATNPTIPDSTGARSSTTDSGPVAGAVANDNSLTDTEIVLVVVMIVLALIALLVIILLIIYCCKKKNRKVDQSNRDYYTGIMQPSTVSESMDTGRSTITDYSGRFIDINDSTDFYTGKGYHSARY